MTKCPTAVFEANVAGLNKPAAQAVPAYRVRIDNKPAEAMIFERLFNLEADPVAQMTFFEAVQPLDFVDHDAWFRRLCADHEARRAHEAFVKVGA